MYKLILPFLCCLITFQTWAQPKQYEHATLQWGEPFKSPRQTSLNDIIGYDNDGFYTISQNMRTRKIYVKHFDPQANFIKSVSLDLSYQKKDMSFEFALQLGEQLYLFSSFKNQKQKKNYLFAQTFNKKTLEPNGNLKMMVELDYSEGSRRNSGGFGHSLSMDSTQLLITGFLPYKKGDPERFSVNVFNTSDLSKKWQKHVELPYVEELFDVKRYRIDGAGNVYILGKLYKDKRQDERKGIVNYTYKVIGYTNQGSDVTEYPVELPGKHLNDMQIAINSNGDLTCAGFYATSNSDAANGTFFMVIDHNTKEVKQQSTKELSDELIKEQMTERQKKKSR